MMHERQDMIIIDEIAWIENKTLEEILRSRTDAVGELNQLPPVRTKSTQIHIPKQLPYYHHKRRF